MSSHLETMGQGASGCPDKYSVSASRSRAVWNWNTVQWNGIENWNTEQWNGIESWNIEQCGIGIQCSGME